MAVLAKIRTKRSVYEMLDLGKMREKLGKKGMKMKDKD